jgi:molybdenum cofactor biosynthesis enzyme MoaA
MWLDWYNANKLKILVELSSVCNAACPQCDRFKPHTLETHDFITRKKWSVGEFQSAFSPQELQHMDHIVLSGLYGEPTTCRDLLEIVAYVRENSPNTLIQLTTNGSTRTEEWWQQLGLVGGEKLSVQFDVDGIDQGMHSRYRRNTDLAKILRNMRAFANVNPNVGVLTIVFEHNERYLQDIKALTAVHGAQHWDQIESARFSQERHSVYTYTDKDGIWHELKQSNHQLLSYQPETRKIRNFQLSDINYSDSTHEITCAAADQARLQMDYNGNVWPCCWMQTEADHGDESVDSNVKFIQSLRASGDINIFKHSLETILSTDWFSRGLEKSIEKCSTANKACIKWCSKTRL